MLLVDGGESSAGLVYVDNLVDAAVSASKVPNTVGKAYNITDDETVSWKPIRRQLAGGMGVKSAFSKRLREFRSSVGRFFEGVWSYFFPASFDETCRVSALQGSAVRQSLSREFSDLPGAFRSKKG